MQEHDLPIIEHLTGIVVNQTKIPDTKITVDMTFSHNDFFKNANLSFTAIMDESEQSCVEVKGTEIEW